MTVREERMASRRISFPGRVIRVLHAGLASAFAACALVQVFFAGMGAFGADWSWHTAFVHTLAFLALAMILVSFLGRLPWGVRLASSGLLVLIGTQYAIASVAVPVATLHPVNGFLILLLSLGVAWRSWAAVQEKG